MNLKIVLFLCIQYSLGTVIGNELTAEFVSHLPKALNEHSAIYDGDDSIYIFGGLVGGSYNLDIYRYSVRTFGISSVGKLLTGGFGGSLQIDSNGNVFYIAGRNIQKFDVSTQTTTYAANPPYAVFYSSSAKYNESKVIIIGGNGGCNKTLSFDMVTNTITEVGTLPFQFCDVTASTVEDEAFLFGGEYSPLVKLNLKTLQTETLYPAGYPGFYYTRSVTAAEKFIYVGLGHKDLSGEISQGIYQFDTDTLQSHYNSVSNFFEESEYFFYPPANVYVEKENRVYYFGGETFLYNNTLKRHDEIWYLDLSQVNATVAPTTEVNTASTPTAGPTMDPDIFNCKNRTDGSYPHPSDCSKFIICRDEHMEVFECQPPLLFDPLLGNCHWPDDVDCGLTCVDKPDGPYPHPHDCALFIDCHGGKLDVFKCSEGLLFDPVFKTCRYADLVDCDGK